MMASLPMTITDTATRQSTPGEGSSQSSAPRKLAATQLAAQQLVDEVRLSGGCAHVSLTT